MKIAFIIGSFPTLSETFILNQITGLIDRGHEIDIFARKKKINTKLHPNVKKYNLLERTYYLNHQNMPLNKFSRLIKAVILIFVNFVKNPIAILKSLNFFKYGKEAISLKLLYYIYPLLGKGSYDIISCHSGPNGNLAVLLKSLGAINGKIVTTFHGSDMSRFIRKYGNKAYSPIIRRGALFLPISKLWKEKLIKLGFNKNKIIVHRMGIEPEKFKFSTDSNDGIIQLLTVGRLVEKKGIEYGIRAVAKVLKKCPNIEYKIAGGGILWNELKNLIEKLEVGNKVKLLGWQNQDEILALMYRADILLAPSVTSRDGDQEGIPVTLMEALAARLPVISTKHSCIPEIIQESKTGFLVPERDVDNLVEKLTFLLDHPEIWTQMGRTGRKFVERYHNINKLNDKLVKIYQKLLDCKIL